MLLVNEPVVAQSAMKRVEKAWGVEYWLLNEEFYCCKLLKVNPGYQCSIHAHRLKDETFVGLMGTVRLNIHDGNGRVQDVHAIHPGTKYHIRPEVFHSFQALNVAWVMEVSTFHDDKDVIRLQESRRLDVK